MRPGPSTEALSGAVAVGARVDVWYGPRTIASDIPCSNVVFEATTDRVVPSRVTLDVPVDMVPTQPQDPMSNYGQRIRVVSLLEVNGMPYEVQLGWFLVRECTGEGRVTADDLMQVLVENDMAWPSSPPAGATLLSELRRLSQFGADGVGLPVVLEVPDRRISRNFQWGFKRADAVRDLCTSQGLAYGVKSDGMLHVWAQPTKCEPAAHYSAADLVVSMSREPRERIPNRWVVAGSPQGDEATKWTAVSTNFQGEYAPALYGVVTDRREFAAATSYEAVVKAADTYKRTALEATGKITLGLAMDPRLELGDDVTALVETDDGHQEAIAGRVVALSMSLDDPGQPMRVDVKEMNA